MPEESKQAEPADSYLGGCIDLYSKAYYGALERGEFNMTVDTLMTVAEGLGVPAWEIWKSAGL